MVVSQQDMLVLAQGGLAFALRGATNNDAPPSTNLHMRLQHSFRGMALESTPIGFGYATPPTFFSAGCPCHMFLTRFTVPMLPGHWASELAPIGTYRLGSDDDEDDGGNNALTLKYDISGIVDGSELLLTGLRVQGVTLTDALVEWAASIRTRNMSSTGGYGTSRIDACSGPACNPTCPASFELTMNRNNSDVNDILFAIFVFYAVLAAVSVWFAATGKLRDRELLQKSIAHAPDVTPQETTPAESAAGMNMSGAIARLETQYWLQGTTLPRARGCLPA